ncbi:MAG: hypothetical protein Q7W45_06055 [Bacteroidota bacterium]|nr:hypothetical protein [Bacteroidota bacterium]MDP3145011.1 hypothetical protein [Bacteroidota bacterium]
MKYFNNILFTLLMVFCAKFSFGQIRVDAALDSSKIRIGEQVKLDLYVIYDSYQGDLKIQWPTIGDTITGKIEVISINQIDTTIPDKNNPNLFQQHQQIVVSAYDSGYFAIPGFKFIVNDDTTKPFFTQTLILEVHTVPTDTSLTKIKDIKPPFEQKFNWKWYLDYFYWGIGIIIFIATIILLTVYFTRRNKQIVIVPEKPKIPAHITALASLDKIKLEQIWKEGNVKEYYSSISDAIRLYIEERFNVHALESTTDEIMTAFRTQVVDKLSKEKLQQTLTLSDLVKFAKLTPIEDEHNFTLQNAYDFVNGTKREEEIAIPEETQTTNPPNQ